MFHKFNDTSIYTKFIKSLVATTYTPTIQVWKPNMPIIKGFQYLTENYIVEALETWPNVNDTSSLDSIYNSKYFKFIKPYVPGEFYRGITTNYVSDMVEYDTETHYYLGQYLRMLRDLKHIDLMPFYNCVSGENNKLKITDLQYNTGILNGKIITDKITDDNYKVITARINFNQKYTVYISSDMPVYLTSICYDGLSRVNMYQPNEGVLKYSRCSYSKPFIYEVPSTGINKYEMYYKNYLTLLIQVPKTCNQVVVLEGDYLSNKLITLNQRNEIVPTIFNFENSITFNDLNSDDIDRYCKIIPKLTRSVKDTLYAYDDKLIEYLLKNVIHHEDDITDNVARIQDYAMSYGCEKFNGIRFKPNKYTKGVWDNNLRVFLYDLMTKPHSSGKISTDPITVNITGYVDKDTETIVTRGQDV